MNPRPSAAAPADAPPVAQAAAGRPSRVRFERAGAESPVQRLDRLTEQWRDSHAAVAREHARQAHILAEVVEIAERQGDADPVLALRSYAAELAAVTRTSDRAILGRLREAHTLVFGYPAAVEALEGGRIAPAHARVIAEEGERLPAELRRPYEQRVLAITCETTAGRLRPKARRIAEALQPEAQEERHVRAAEHRRVWLRDLPDGMAELGAELPAVLAHGIYDRLTRGGRAARRRASAGSSAPDASAADVPAADIPGADVPGADIPGAETRDADTPDADISADTPADPRALDQLRADLLCELLLTGVSPDPTPAARTVAGIVPRVTITVPVEGPGPATLGGYGPIDATTARRLSAVAPGWDRIAVDESGGVLATDRYRPTEAMRRVLEARDEHCRFPGCRMPVERCDVDHTVEWAAGGRTEVDNLAHLCRRHHALKHPDLAIGIRWSVAQRPDGVLVWHSPTGRCYEDLPERMPPPGNPENNVTRARAVPMDSGPPPW